MRNQPGSPCRLESNLRLKRSRDLAGAVSRVTLESCYLVTDMSVNYPPSCPQHLSLRAKLKPSCRRKLRGSIWSWRQRLQYCSWGLVRMQGKSEAIARGLACGVFAGLFPIFELNTQHPLSF